MKPFLNWEVEGTDYKLKLTTGEISKLEQKYDMDIVSLMMNNGQIPKLSTMLDITHAAMQKFNHGISRSEVNTIYDNWLASDEENNMMSFYSTVYMGIACVSGFFPKAVAEEMMEQMQNPTPEEN